MKSFGYILANDNKNILGKDTLSPMSSVMGIEKDMLVFKDENALNRTLLFLSGKNESFIDQWDYKNGLKSMRKTFNDISIAEAGWLKKFKPTDEDINKDGRPALYMKEFNSNRNAVVMLKRGSGDQFLEKNVFFDAYSKVLNRDGMVKIGGEVYQYTKDKLINLTDGELVDTFRIGNSYIGGGMDLDYDYNQSNDITSNCDCKGNHGSMPNYLEGLSGHGGGLRDDFNQHVFNSEIGDVRFPNRGSEIDGRIVTELIPQAKRRTNVKGQFGIASGQWKEVSSYRLECEDCRRNRLGTQTKCIYLAQDFYQQYDTWYGGYRQWLIITVWTLKKNVNWVIDNNDITIKIHCWALGNVYDLPNSPVYMTANNVCMFQVFLPSFETYKEHLNWTNIPTSFNSWGTGADIKHRTPNAWDRGSGRGELNLDVVPHAYYSNTPQFPLDTKVEVWTGGGPNDTPFCRIVKPYRAGQWP